MPHVKNDMTERRIKRAQGRSCEIQPSRDKKKVKGRTFKVSVER
jgi:hypothetical protein